LVAQDKYKFRRDTIKILKDLFTIVKKFLNTYGKNVMLILFLAKKFLM